MYVRRSVTTLLALCSLVLFPALASAASRTHHHVAEPRGGKVLKAWPRTGATAGKPSAPLAQWLAKQVGETKLPACEKTVTVRRHGKLTHEHVLSSCAGDTLAQTDLAHLASPDATTVTVPFASTGVGTGNLALVRSYQIPANDPSATRLANLSWTYDSAVTAISFIEDGYSTEAAQLLSQLAALQRSDGSIDFAYNTSNGQSIAEFRAGTIAWVGLAAVDYHLKTCSTAYDNLAYGAAQYLLTLQTSDGLVNGGPDVTWQSASHNFVVRAFLHDLAQLINRNKIGPAAGGVTGSGAGSEVYSPCSGQTSAFAGMTATQGTAFASTLNTAVAKIDAGINANLFVRLTPASSSNPLASAGTAYFREGTNDDLRPVDAQALGIMWLLAQGRTTDAQAVFNYTNATMLKSTFTVGISLLSSTFNDTYTGTGPYLGYTPYDTSNAPSTPDVMWEEGTLQMGEATQLLDTVNSVDWAISGAALYSSQLAFLAITGTGTGPLQASGTVTGSVFNEYHPWPSSAAAAWALLNATDFSLLSDN